MYLDNFDWMIKMDFQSFTRFTTRKGSLFQKEHLHNRDLTTGW